MCKELTLEQRREPYWQKLESVIGAESTAAMKEIYALYTEELVDWFASLYDVQTGGYYYSESARDNEGFLPDAESTNQALGFWNASGMLAEVGGSYTKGLPQWMQEDICRFVDSLQDPDGYFYHPQWGKNISLSRRGRDLNWCRRMLGFFGKKPRYATILDATPAKDGETLIPDHLATAEAFAEYLESLNIPERSYHKGSELSSQFSQIAARGFGGQLIEFLNGLQHPETGVWHREANYYGINGLMKLSGVYASAGLLLPNAPAAARSAAAAIVSDEPVGAVVDIWNTWIAVSRVCTVLRSSGGEEGNRQADDIVAMMRDRAAECLGRTREKLAPFRKSGSSFSYSPHRSSPTSQGVPAAVKDTREGDVNATVIATSLMVNAFYDVLEVPAEARVPIFFEQDRRRYVELLEKKRKETLSDN